MRPKCRVKRKRQNVCHTLSDDYGYGRIPAFWFTLNLPFNYFFEIHRFQSAVERLALERCGDEHAKTVDCLDSVSRAAMEARCNWVLNNPDIVVTLHAIRVEILIN